MKEKKTLEKNIKKDMVRLAKRTLTAGEGPDSESCWRQQWRKHNLVNRGSSIEFMEVTTWIKRMQRKLQAARGSSLKW